jgi:predicted nucleic acid-binding protein
MRTVRRYRPDRVGGARLLLSGVDFIEISDDVLESAASLQPLTLRSLDAIHLASAQSLMEALGVLVTYDQRMVEAAHQLGLSVASPT